jgi:hypothetical protein
MRKLSASRRNSSKQFCPHLDHLEERNPPSDTLSVVLAQLGEWNLLGSALPDFGSPVMGGGNSSANVPLAGGVSRSPELNPDFAEPVAALRAATPQPLTQWLDDDWTPRPANIELEDSIGNAAGPGFAFNASFSSGSVNEAGTGAAFQDMGASFAGLFGGGAMFGAAAGMNGLDALSPASPLPNSNTSAANANPGGNQNQAGGNNAGNAAAGQAAANNLPANAANMPPPAQNTGSEKFDRGGGSGGGGQEHHDATGIFVVGPDAGHEPLVKVYDANLHYQYSFDAFPESFQGGVRVAVGDLNGDGTQEITVGAGPGGGSQVNVFSGSDGHLLYSFNAFNAGYTDGVYVATGDLNGDGKQEIIVGTDVGSTAPMVKVFDGASGNFLFSVMADDASMHGGVRVAAGDVKGTGHDDIITADGPGGPPRVCVFDGVTHQQFYDFFAADPSYTGGIYVAAGDVDGTGNIDIVTGTGTGSNVQVFRGSDDAMIDSFQAFDSSFNGGARVTTAELDASNVSEIVVGTGPGDGLVRAYDARKGSVVIHVRPYGGAFQDGLFVAGVLAPPSTPVDPLPVVTISTSATDLVDSSSATATITVTRTGDLTNGMSVYFNYSGTAAGGTDFTAPVPPTYFPPRAIFD